MMRKLMLVTVLCVAFGLPANGAGFLSGTKIGYPAKRLACHWETADRALRLLRYTALPNDKNGTKAPVVRTSPAMMTVADRARFERPQGQRISLTVGVAY
jgi:hypothetical protein